MKGRKKYLLLGVCAAVILALGTWFLLVWNGILFLNNPSREQYPVRGVDVSSYQGEIDWQKLASQDISFAFIKATEGSSWVDEKFSYNYAQAREAGLRVGAYHFFSYDSPGRTQAENFIEVVEKFPGMLPPVIDIEFYGDKEANPPEPAQVRSQLDVLITMLEDHYGRKPILYATGKSYTLYLADRYEECDIWIRNVLTNPKLPDGREWTFWQYTDRRRLDGYQGQEDDIDLNVFCGTEEEFRRYPE